MFKKTSCVFIIALVSFVYCGCSINEISEDVIITGIETLSEYGSYYGAKSANLSDSNAKIYEESFRVCLQFLNNDELSDYFDADELLNKVPDGAKQYIEEALNYISEKYISVHGKISSKYVKYFKAVFSGAFNGIEKYRKSINNAEIQSNYAVELSKRYMEAKKSLK